MRALERQYAALRRWGAGLKGPWRYHLSRLAGSPNAFLKLCHGGVIHVGANNGNERILYAQNRLKVVWIEAIPEIYAELQRNIEGYPNQRAIHALVTDRDGETVTLHVSNNSGLSSSILALHHHKDIWPEVHYVRDLVMRSMTLETTLAAAAVDLAQYEALVMDTQGSELRILKGASNILSGFKFIQIEAADFEIYEGCCTGQQLVEFLEPHGFRVLRKDIFASTAYGGHCFELLFARA